MKKILLCSIILAALVFVVGAYAQEDWTQYESGTNNIRVDGYGGQSGYIAFGDGNGTILGYMWFDAALGIVFCSKGSQTGMTSGTSLQRSKSVPAAGNNTYKQ